MNTPILLVPHVRTMLGEFHPHSLEPDRDRPDLQGYVIAWSSTERSAGIHQLLAIATGSEPVLQWLEKQPGDDLQNEETARGFLKSLADFVADPTKSQPDVGDYRL